MKKLVPVYQENAVDDDLLNEGRRNLRNYLQTKGYFDATVEVSRQPVPDEDQVNIVYKIDEGERHELEVVKIVGNKYFDEATIRERLTVQPKSWILTNGRFSQRMMTDDAGIHQGALPGERISGREGRCRSGRQLRIAQRRTGGGVPHHGGSADPGQESGDRGQQQLHDGTTCFLAEQRSGTAVQRSRYHERSRCDHVLLLQPRISRRAV